MESSDIISDLINENQIDSEGITAEMEMLDKLALNKENEENEDPILTDNFVQEENSKDVTELVGETVLEDKVTRPCQFALSRIKTIMKYDPDLALASKESVYAIAKATEFFVDFISKEAYKFTSQGSRKTLQKKDIDLSVNTVDALCFLDAALD